MQKYEYLIQFNTPAFIGDAFQQGQWRTPPFKALLRQWWRVIKACELLKNGGSPKDLHSRVREAEGRLFGHAWLEDTKDPKRKKWAMRSQVKIRLSQSKGKALSSLPKVDYVCHPEIDLKKNRDREQFYCKVHRTHHLIDPLLYLGYGPIFRGRINKPISLQDEAKQTILCCSSTKEIEETIKLIHLFGTIGGRSRNGWGSLVLQSKNGQELPELSKILDKNNTQSRKWLSDYSRDFSPALDLDWCHAIGKDEKGLLLWRSKGDFPSWGEAMRHLAEVKIELRTQFHFKGAGPHSSLCDRQILAYPVTKHSLGVWGNARSANQLFFKVHRLENRFVPIIVHLPHGIPEKLKEELNTADNNGLKKREEDVWKKVHKVIDQKMQRLS